MQAVACYHYILGLCGLCRLFAEVLGQRNANCPEHGSDLTRDTGPGGDGRAVLFDGRLLLAVEIIEERLPFGLEALGIVQAGQFLGQDEGEERTEHMPADGRVGLMEDRTRVEAFLGGTEQGLDLKQIPVADNGL